MPKKGFKHSKESKKKMSQNMKGRVPFNKGKKLSTWMSEDKNELRKQKIKKTVSIRRRERKEKLGYINSDETKKKIKDTLKEGYATGRIKNNSGCFKKGGISKKKGKTYEELYGLEKGRRLRKIKIENRKNQIFPLKDSSIEVKIQKFLKQLGIEYFTHQYMKIEHGYQCDILIPSMNLVIECDGDYWHKYPIGNEKDHIRTSELIEKGFRVLRLWECEINKMGLVEFKEKIGGFK